MANEKKSFLFYFDNYPMVQALPPDQRGWLLSVLCTYADRVWRDETVTMTQVMEGFPQLSLETRVACSFLGGTILRDTRRWLDQRRMRQERRGGTAHSVGPRQAPQEPAEQEEQRAREDMERMRRLMEQMKQEDSLA